MRAITSARRHDACEAGAQDLRMPRQGSTGGRFALREVALAGALARVARRARFVDWRFRVRRSCVAPHGGTAMGDGRSWDRSTGRVVVARAADVETPPEVRVQMVAP